MRNNIFIFWVLILVDGVFGVDTDGVKSVSVMEGDSVTLNTDLTEIQRDNRIIWKFDKEIIAKIHEAETIFNTYDGHDGRFRDRLKLDEQTGSLTITNIRTEHVGLYSVDIKSTDAKLKTFKVTVHDEVVSVSVIKGDSVTLHTGVTEKQRDDQIVWKFGEQGDLIADLNSPVDSSWKNIHLNDQTGDLTIRNIQIDQSGDYKMEINNISMILHRKFYMAVGGVKTVSVKEGDPVNLHTGVIAIKGFDVILWKTDGDLVAEINQVTNRFSLYDSGDVRFSGRLDLDRQSGDLTISDAETTDSGVYHLHMSSSTHTLQRNISVTVKNSGNSGAVSGISGASVALVVWAVTVFLLQEV
ncbi:uncharacterized protein [Chanodichthys erythropterus]|uniref:uncharacterized protein n=1 Tax=Chanodichthys erythropterus TaxID=933992 RepID=UPI00351E9902